MGGSKAPQGPRRPQRGPQRGPQTAPKRLCRSWRAAHVVLHPSQTDTLLTRSFRWVHTDVLAHTQTHKHRFTQINCKWRTLYVWVQPSNDTHTYRPAYTHKHTHTQTHMYTHPMGGNTHIIFAHIVNIFTYTSRLK